MDLEVGNVLAAGCRITVPSDDGEPSAGADDSAVLTSENGGILNDTVAGIEVRRGEEIIQERIGHNKAREKNNVQIDATVSIIPP